jgi:hypothetical protein
MKYVLMTAVLALAACTEKEADRTTDMTSICIDGVSYWLEGAGGSQMMAPRISPDTLTFVRC